jgi:hypothetical protein
MAAGIGARAAVLTAAGLVALAVPSACSLSRYRPASATGEDQRPITQYRMTQHPITQYSITLRRQMAEGFAVIVARRPLLRATVTSVVSYAGAQRLGGAARGALLISAIAVTSLTANAILARRPRRRRSGQLRRRRPDTWVLASTLVIGASMAAAALAPGWLTLTAVALGGAGEGPQLTALLAVRHRETPAHMRGQVYTTAASLKIAGLAAGTALAGPMAGWSVTGCLLIAAGTQLVAAAAYLLAGPTRQGRREPTGRNGEPAAGGSRPAAGGGGPTTAPPGTAGTGAGADRPVRSG